MNDAQSTIVGLKAQDCPGGGWNGMPAALEGKATVADCVAHGVCGCIYGDAVQHIERLGRCHRIVAMQTAYYKPDLPDFTKVDIHLGVLRAAERCAGKAPWELDAVR